MAAPDPSWKDAFSYLWAVLLVPVGMVWRKVDGAASKEDLEVHRKEDRESFRQLFANAEDDRKLVRDGFERISTEMHAMENRLRDRIDAK